VKNGRLTSSVTDKIRRALSSPITSDGVLDPHNELAGILAAVGLEPSACGGSITFHGKDPILKSPWPLATMAGAALMAKAVAIADVWRYRTGKGQDLSLDLRQAPHRLCPFYDQKWELLNGFAPSAPNDPTNPFMPSHMYPTRNGRWIQLLNIYPKAKTRALAFLGCPDNHQAISQVTRKWNAFELEEEANRAGLQATVIRSAEEFLDTEQYSILAEQPLISIEKIGESEPEPFTESPQTPLDGVRALGVSHVIAGAGLGRALAYHGADVLNLWRPLDFELDQVYYSSSVGMRSSTVDFGQPEGIAKLKALVGDADVFFANKRPGFLNSFHLTAEDLAFLRPGIIHVDMSLYGPTGPLSGRTGYDQNAGGVAGVLTREGTFENPTLTEIFVVNDYIMAWLSAMAVASTLKRRAVEGGSYRIQISLVRLSMWLLHIGIFDKAYAYQVGNTSGDHAYLPPITFEADTPCGHYLGVTDQVKMSESPGSFRFPVLPRGSSKPVWLGRNSGGQR